MLFNINTFQFQNYRAHSYRYCCFRGPVQYDSMNDGSQVQNSGYCWLKMCLLLPLRGSLDKMGPQNVIIESLSAEVGSELRNI